MLRIELNQDGDLNLKGLVSLTKGKNAVDENAWEKVADDELTQWYVEQGTVVVFGDAVVIEEDNRVPAPADQLQLTQEPEVHVPEGQEQPGKPDSVTQNRASRKGRHRRR
jgi:hypothetical protein